MLRIRLRRTGARNQASYRIVVADSRKPRDGRFVDYLGHYNPRFDPPEMVLDSEKAQKWIEQGAQPSDAVRRIIEKVASESEDTSVASESEDTSD